MDKATAEVLTLQLKKELEAVLALQQQQASANADELAQLGEELALARRQHLALRDHSGSQLRALQRQLSRVRAEKGALCEEFSQKLSQLTRGGTVEAGSFFLRLTAGGDGGAAAGADASSA
eukprot:3055317-Prymnesium_polylepis.1